MYIKSLNRDFGLTDPILAISALNPHNGEDGKIGNEEIKIITPVIEKLKNKEIKYMDLNQLIQCFIKMR